MGYVGHLLILLAGGGLGFWLSHRLTRQVRYLDQAVILLQEVEQQMAFSARPMTEIWVCLAENVGLCGYPLLRGVLSRLDGEDASVAFAGAVEEGFAAGLLTPVGRQILLEYGAGCGVYDMARQLAHVRHHRDRLTQHREDLHRQMVEKGRLYQVMGLAGGGALALLLL